MIIIMDMASGATDTLQCPTQDIAPTSSQLAARDSFLRRHYSLQLGLQEVVSTQAPTPSPTWHPELR